MPSWGCIVADAAATLTRSGEALRNAKTAADVKAAFAARSDERRSSRFGLLAYRMSAPALLSRWAKICFQIETSSVTIHSCVTLPSTMEAWARPIT